MKSTLHTPRSTSSLGFTVVEMMVATALFSMVVLMCVAALVSIMNANSRARAVKTTMDNLYLVLDNLARDLRLGSRYTCQLQSNTNPLSIGANASGGDCPYSSGGGSYFAFRNKSGKVELYRFDSTEGCVLRKETDVDWSSGYTDSGVGTCSAPQTYSRLTSSDITIERFQVYVYYTGVADRQPYLVLAMQGRAGSGVTAQTRFGIMTSISQRIPHNTD